MNLYDDGINGDENDDDDDEVLKQKTYNTRIKQMVYFLVLVFHHHQCQCFCDYNSNSPLYQNQAWRLGIQF